MSEFKTQILQQDPDHTKQPQKLNDTGISVVVLSSIPSLIVLQLYLMID